MSQSLINQEKEMVYAIETKTIGCVMRHMDYCEFHCLHLLECFAGAGFVFFLIDPTKITNNH